MLRYYAEEFTQEDFDTLAKEEGKEAQLLDFHFIEKYIDGIKYRELSVKKEATDENKESVENEGE